MLAQGGLRRGRSALEDVRWCRFRALYCRNHSAHFNAYPKVAPATLEALHGGKNVTGSQVRFLKFLLQSEGDRRLSGSLRKDFGSITLLFNSIGGLQLLPPGIENSEENWQLCKTYAWLYDHQSRRQGDAAYERFSTEQDSSCELCSRRLGNIHQLLPWILRSGRNEGFNKSVGESEVILPLENAEAELNMSAQD